MIFEEFFRINPACGVKNMANALPGEELLKLCQITLEAGARIMEIYAAGSEVKLKDDNSPVTEADVAAEKIILDGLKNIDPATAVIAEEATAAGKVPKAHKRFYLVDPLDGTREFISRNGEFTVNIALIENGAPIAGVIFAPAIGRLFCGAKDAGAFQTFIKADEKLQDAQWRQMQTALLPKTGLIAVASRSHRDEKTEKWLAENNIDKVVSAGSSLKFCLVAAGEAHLYPRFGRTMEWDTGAGNAIIVAAGGMVVTEDGKPLSYGKQERGFDNPAFFVSAPTN